MNNWRSETFLPVFYAGDLGVSVRIYKGRFHIKTRDDVVSARVSAEAYSPVTYRTFLRRVKVSNDHRFYPGAGTLILTGPVGELFKLECLLNLGFWHYSTYWFLVG